jgi:hypothetical protein
MKNNKDSCFKTNIKSKVVGRGIGKIRKEGVVVMGRRGRGESIIK